MKPLPQHATVPVAVTAHACSSPCTIAVAPTKVGMGVGSLRRGTNGMPSTPLLLKPQQAMLPSVPREQVLLEPR
jgi:hypothetical protein